MTRAVVLSLPWPREPKKPLERVLVPGATGHVTESESEADAVLRGFAGLEPRSPYRLTVGGRSSGVEPTLRANLGVALTHEPPETFAPTTEEHLSRARAFRTRRRVLFDVAFGDAWARSLPKATKDLSTRELRFALALGLALELERPTALLLAPPRLSGELRELFVSRYTALAERTPILLVSPDDHELDLFTSARLLHQGTPPVVLVHALVTRAAEVAKFLTEQGESPTIHATGSEFSRLVLPCRQPQETTARLLGAVTRSDARLRSLRAERYHPETIR